MRVIEVRNLKKTYKKGKILAVDGISFDVNEQEIYIFVGPDGAGKSSTLKIVAGVLRYDSGKVVVFGKEIKEDKEAEKLRDKIAFMPQGLGLNLYHTLSVEENIDFFADLHDVPKDVRERRKEMLLKATGLLPFKDRPAGKLSGGMMQKLGICCSLIHTPKLIVLDEPTTGVDPVSRRELWKLIYEFVHSEDITAVVSTSYLDEAERSTTLSIMKNGKIIKTADPDGLVPESIKVFEVRGKDVERAYEIAWEKFKVPRLKGKVLRFVAETDDLSAFKGLQLEIRKVEPNVEDVFLLQTGLRRLNLTPFFEIKTQIPEKAVVVKDVVKKFGDFTAVNGVSFEVKRGEIFGLLGPNGAGKTTLIKIMTGLLHPSEGRCLIAGKETGKEIKEIIGYMSQKFSLYSDLTVYENMFLWGKVYGVDTGLLKDRIEDALRLVDLQNFRDEIVENLPLGIKQRLALMCAVVHGPAVLFLDEPTSGVDPAERDGFWQIIRFLSKKIGVTVIVTTHYMDEAEYCDRLMLMNRGKSIALGTPSALKEETLRKIGKIYEIKTPKPFPDLQKLQKAGFSATLYGKRIRIYTKKKLTEEDIKELSIEVLSFKEAEITMEDVFVYAVGEHESQKD